MAGKKNMKTPRWDEARKAKWKAKRYPNHDKKVPTIPDIPEVSIVNQSKESLEEPKI